MIWVVMASVVAILIFLNALFVAAEFGSISARPNRVRLLANQGNRLAQSVIPILEDPFELDRYIAASQIGITISSLVLGAYAQAKIATRVEPWLADIAWLQNGAARPLSIAIVLSVLIATQMVLGELVPKAVAIRYPVRTAIYTVVPMKWCLHLFSWFITVLNGSGNAILRLMGIRTEPHRHIHSAEEIEMIISESDLRPGENERLRSALHLGGRPVRQLMIPRRSITAIEASTPINEVYEIAVGSPYTRLPVYRETIDDIIGTLHTKDLVAHYLRDRGAIDLKTLLRKVTHIPESASADQVLQAFREQRTHQAIVLDEFGGVEGLVTIDDVLDEVIGGIADEFKEADPVPERLPDGRVRLPGFLRLYEAEPWVGILWTGESETVGGLVSERLGHLPEKGEVVSIDGVEVEVDEVESRAVVWVIARGLSVAKDGDDE